MGIERVARWLAEARSGVGFTGAGISTESGISDFRGPGGFWERNDQGRFTLENWLCDAEHRRAEWAAARSGNAWDGQSALQPNAGHAAFARLERIGAIRGVVTQNVDGLHHAAGSTRVLELHGTARTVGCVDCRHTLAWEEVLVRLRAGEDDPRCEDCGGILKRSTISFGEGLPADVFDEAYRWSVAADVYIVAGSSLQVTPAALLPQLAAESGAKLAIVNRQPTPLDPVADVVLRTDAGPTLSAIVELVERTR